MPCCHFVFGNCMQEHYFFFFNSNLMIFIRRRARVMGSLVEINRSSFQLRTILLDVISSPTSHVTYKRYLPSFHKMCFSLAFFQSTVDMQDPIHLWSWSCKDMSLEMTSSHWPHLERSRSTLRESLTDKQKKKERIAEDHPHSFIRQVFLECHICARHCFRRLENTSEQNRQK